MLPLKIRPFALYEALIQQLYSADWSLEAITLLIAALLISSILIYFFMVRKVSIYLVDYACVKYNDEDKAGSEVLLYFLQGMSTVAEKDVVFQTKVFLKSGVGEEAYVPRANLEKGRHLRMQDSYDQSHILVVRSVDELLKKTGISPQQIDIVIVNSGMFNPTPSLTSMLVNYFKMRPDVKTFHLGGMGCSAGLISVDLAKDLLRVYYKTANYALIASTEVIQALYDGKDRSMMVTNCLFRSAGNALLISNRRKDKSIAKLQLLHLVRVCTAAQDEAHNVVIVKEDEDGVAGAQLSNQLINVASEALRINIKKLAPRVLPVGELYKAGLSEVKRNVLKMKDVKPYVPNFKLAFDHFCIHPGGKAVIEGVGKSLSLSAYDTEPSMMSLHRFGNTSCSGVWYILAYSEAKRRLQKGDKVWQIGLGSGFKCTTAVWRVLKTIDKPVLEGNPWQDCIHRYPVLEELFNLPHVRSVTPFLDHKSFKGAT